MALKNINPTTTKAWQDLSDHFNEIEKTTLKELHLDKNRQAEFSIQNEDVLSIFLRIESPKKP